MKTLRAPSRPQSAGSRPQSARPGGLPKKAWIQNFKDVVVAVAVGFGGVLVFSL